MAKAQGFRGGRGCLGFRVSTLRALDIGLRVQGLGSRV